MQSLSDSGAAGAWLNQLDWPERREAVVAVMVDAEMCPLRTDWIGRGGPSSTPLFVRRLAGLALVSEARGVVIAHNHPSGCPRPSSADRRLTSDVARLLSDLGVTLLDHLILGREGWTSMWDQRLL